MLTWQETFPGYHVAETPTLQLVAFVTMFGLASFLVSRKSDPHRLVTKGGVRTLLEVQLECERLAGELG